MLNDARSKGRANARKLFEFALGCRVYVYARRARLVKRGRSLLTRCGPQHGVALFLFYGRVVLARVGLRNVFFRRHSRRSDARRECKREGAEENDSETPDHSSLSAIESGQTVEFKGDARFAQLVCKMLKVQIFHELVIFKSHFSTDFSTASVEI